MFRKQVTAFAFLFSLIAGLVFYLHWTRVDDPVDDNPRPIAMEAQQIRSCVSKDFWVPNSDARVHAFLQGDQSELQLAMRRGKIDGIESLVGVIAETSEGHHFTASGGVYAYPANQFTAFDATIESAGLLKGRAKRIELPLTGSEMRCLGGVELNAEKERLHLEAEEGVVTFKEGLSLSEIHCIGSVRLRRDDTFALARQFDYLAREQMAILSCLLPERVLFWQQTARLSAPEVRMSLGSGKVEGLGDVHFSFDLEEQNLFDAIFAKYL